MERINAVVKRVELLKKQQHASGAKAMLTRKPYLSPSVWILCSICHLNSPTIIFFLAEISLPGDSGCLLILYHPFFSSFCLLGFAGN